MLITQIVEDLTDFLNDTENKQLWTDQAVTVEAAFDIERCMCEGLGVYVLPSIFVLNTEQGGRVGVEALQQGNYVSLVISRRFTGIPTSPHTTEWSEAKQQLDMWQKATQLIATRFLPSGTSLDDIEPLPPEELAKDHTNFLVSTAFLYQETLCDIQLDFITTPAE